ncbi:uncharacterized protein PGTG_14838 [Puccinia graminis f. sp. tritici CRL 75-36-700-3]|uniref:UEV domain-containing protein n=1 Tax=Puccinia graminis f. sp. tritici (strain CRL 75-36-700-3 / race SCCL) TaxID=418459 RepID=E3KWF8_PUCGT|nr:uncharacterized protein PGTG_14838 [Puccinia graminis f. sp. tritici CRL 75-36-700-3]EFP88633.2 hypothetical protein PGTG_14838 [Puccinia graminis f. sp. tritici CRL 75-36-700-3]
MPANRESVKRWLTQVLLPYPTREQALNQIQSTLEHYPSLSPKTESFTFDDGRTALLVSLTGTIPVHYRALSYNIPIAIWLPFEFPTEPPIIYLTPTNEMIIRKGTHVEPGGKCIAGYFNSWQSKPEACSLKELLEFLQDVFSREPPLYSKPKPPAPAYSSQPPTSQITSTSSQQQQQQQQPPRPPLPPQLARSLSTNSSLAHPDPQSRPTPPIRPPLPPPLYSQSSQSLTPSSSTPPLHLRPNSNSIQFIQPLSSVSHSRTVSATQPVTSHPNQSPPHNFDHQLQECRRSMSAFSNPPNHHPSSAQNTIISRPLEQQLDSLAITSSTKPNQNLLDDDPLDDESPQMNGRSPSNVPPPPRPPNPGLLSLRGAVHAKLRAESERFKASLQAEQRQLEILETDLLKGEPAILDEIARLEAVNDVCVNVGNRYRDLVEQLNTRFIELTHHRKIVEVDELVCSTTVLYNQLWELIINDKVIEDLVYHLSKALNNSLDGSKIDLEKFLKRVRILGHEQFLIRVTINQICHRLGFSLSSSSAPSFPSPSSASSSSVLSTSRSLSSIATTTHPALN